MSALAIPAGEFSMKFGKSLSALGGRFLRGLEIAPPNYLPPTAYHCAPLSNICAPEHPDISRFVVALLLAIEAILHVRTFAKILKAIVGRVTVDVIDIVLWPSAVHIQPCQAMRRMAARLFGNPNLDVVAHRAAGRLSRVLIVPFRWVSFSEEPSEDSRYRIVGQDRSNKFGGQIALRNVLSHHRLNVWTSRGDLNGEIAKINRKDT